MLARHAFRPTVLANLPGSGRTRDATPVVASTAPTSTSVEPKSATQTTVRSGRFSAAATAANAAAHCRRWSPRLYSAMITVTRCASGSASSRSICSRGVRCPDQPADTRPRAKHNRRGARACSW